MPPPNPRQLSFGDWPETPPEVIRGGRTNRQRLKREPALSPNQCEMIWALLAQHLPLRGGFNSRVADFIVSMSVEGGIRFDLAPYGVKAVFRIEGDTCRVYSDQRALEARIRSANAALACRPTHKVAA